MARERKAQEPGYGFMYPPKEKRENGPGVVGRVRLTRECAEAVMRGEEIEIAAWTKTAASGVRYQSLKVSTIQGDALAQPWSPPIGGPADNTDDDIPF